MDTMVEIYDRFLSELLDKHAPLKKITVVDIPLNEWMTDNILALKAIRRKNKLIWRKTCITINLNIYYDSYMAVKKANSIRKDEQYVSFKCKQPLEAISKLNSCLADIRRWMITNKLMIDYTIIKGERFGSLIRPISQL